MHKRNQVMMVAVLLGGVAIGGLLSELRTGASDATADAPSDVLADALMPRNARAKVLPLPEGVSIADVAARVTPSIVSVFSEKVIELPDWMGHPFFDRFFGRQPDGAKPEPPRQQGLGSGVVIASEGIILTNNHVVERADTIRVEFSDGTDIEATVVGTDPKSDLAVLKVKRSGLTALPLADSAQSRVGEVVLAVGSPFGLSHSVTMGIISALGRANMGITDYENFIQTDAAINPGNSGGALVNMQGQLVGINTAIASRSGGYQGIGFAIPSNMALKIKDSILQHGRVIRGWLGVAIQDITSDLAETMGLKKGSGVLVSDVLPDGPAARAGLKRGDVIVAVDGQATSTASQLRNLIAGSGKDIKVKLDLLRDGRPRYLTVKLAELPGEEGQAAPQAPESDGEALGLRVKNMDQQSRRQFKVPPEVKGVLVVDVDANGPAARFGLRPGDVILEVNRQPTTSISSFKKALTRKEKKLLLLVYREGSTVFLAIRR